MRHGHEALSSVRTEGGLLPQDVLTRIQNADPTLPGTTAESYHLGPHERVGEAASRAWSRLVTLWHSFQDALAREAADAPATRLTRERWLLPLFQELGYGRLPKSSATEIEGKRYPVSHDWGSSPIHLLGCRVDLDRRQRGVAGAARSSPHGLVQEFLNRSDAHLWGFVSNGYVLRVLRDHHSLTRQAYVEFDLQAIMDGEQFSDFLLLWLVCHQSRVEADSPKECWLERWVTAAKDDGVRALDKLRVGVTNAIQSLGTGFLAHRANASLRASLESGALDRQEYYRELLRLVYRLIFLFVAEDREALLVPDANDDAKSRYSLHYGTRRLRQLADARRGGPHADVWRGLSLVMEKLDDGYEPLALPALGSRLWGPDACPSLMSRGCSNEHLLGAVRHLTHIQEGGTKHAVNWRNIGADELGSIYEGLLELHPHLDLTAAVFELRTAAGHERKTTGSYYTHTAIVDALLERALDPVLDDRSSRPDPERALLELTVCDPACGSGHFLVAAARRIARRLASVRSGDDEPSPTEARRALRDVVSHCIYGVDLNPMAAELCKVSLWMEALEPGRPLSFLDSHIQTGNALLGTTPALMSRGIPDDAFKPIEGDDKGVAKRLRKRNKDERKGQTTIFGLFGASPREDLRAVAREAEGIERSRDDTIEHVRQKQARWEALARSPQYAESWFSADAWCAAFVWPLQPGDMENAAVTHGMWKRIEDDISSAPPTTRRTVRALARHYTFFHWHLAFPQVFGAEKDDIPEDDVCGWERGFDVIIGNPPWDTLSPDAKEFFSEYDSAIRTQDRRGQKALMAELLTDATISARWATYRRELYSWVHFLKTSGRYVMYAPGNLGKGDFNVYRMFVELALTSIADGGTAAQVVPDGLYSGANCMAIRQEMFEHGKLHEILGFENNRQIWFDGIDGRTKFCIYRVRRSGRTEGFDAAFGIRNPTDLESVCTGAILRMPVSLVKTFSPKALAIMEFGSQRDVDIAAKMYARHPKFGDESAGPPHRHYMREIDMGNDRALFSEDPKGVPLYEGRMVAQYDHRAKGYRSGRGRKANWEDLPFSEPGKSIQPQWYVPVEKIPEKVRERYLQFRVGFCDVASPTNERSLVATLLPERTIAGHTVPTMVLEGGDMAAYPVWLACANSFALDFLARQKISLHMGFSILDSLPFPRASLPRRGLRYLVPRVLGLVCTAPETREFGALVEAEIGPFDLGAGDPVTDDAQRRQIRAEIDAYVARAIYDLSREDVAYILDTFPIVKKRDVKEFGDYRTKELILNAFDRLGEAGA